jgi:hypothetical protein
MKTKFNLCIMDDFGNPIAKQALNVNWEIDVEKDKKFLQDKSMVEEVARIIEDQIKIDLNKGIVLKMIEGMLNDWEKENR